MRRVLITGGAGFIGANFVHYCQRECPDDRLLILDALTYAGNLANLGSVKSQPALRFVRGDICDGTLVTALLREEQIDTIVHFAAESHVDRSIHEPDAFVKTNIVGTHSLLKSARKVWLEERRAQRHHFHHISTDEVYGSLGPDDPAFHEATSYAPNSPYAASKAASDYLVRSYHRTYGLDCTISHCSNNYGPYQFPEKLIPLSIIKILHGKPLPIYGDGRNVRDWLHVDDHCRAIALILTRGAPGETYNIGGGVEVENLTLANTICEVVGEVFRDWPALRSAFPQCPFSRGSDAMSLITFVKDRPGHDRRYAIDCAKIEQELGYKVSVSLRAGLQNTVLWYLRYTSWWQSVMDGSYQH